MEVIIILLVIALCIAVTVALYYYVQYEKLLREYWELDIEFEKMRRKISLENAKEDAIKKVLKKYRKE